MKIEVCEDCRMDMAEILPACLTGERCKIAETVMDCSSNVGGMDAVKVSPDDCIVCVDEQYFPLNVVCRNGGRLHISDVLHILSFIVER